MCNDVAWHTERFLLGYSIILYGQSQAILRQIRISSRNSDIFRPSTLKRFLVHGAKEPLQSQTVARRWYQLSISSGLRYSADVFPFARTVF